MTRRVIRGIVIPVALLLCAMAVARDFPFTSTLVAYWIGVLTQHYSGGLK